MKTLSIALVAAALVAGPALAQQAPTASAAPAAATTNPASTAPANRTEQSKNWTVGQKVPSVYTATSRFALNNYDEYGLAKPVIGSRWIIVGDNAYLIREATDIITKVVGVTPKG